MLSYHERLPAEEKAIVGGKLQYYSDHMPIISNIPLSNSEFASSLKVISWNMAIPDKEGSGYNTAETPQQETERTEEINESLRKFVNNHSPDVILLQEVFNAEAIRNVVKTLLPEGQWDIVINGELATIYNTNKLIRSQEDKKEEEKKIPGIYVLQKLKFNDSITGKQICVNNLRGLHNDDPTEMKIAVQSLMASDSQFADVVIVGGDFNNRYVIPGKKYLVNNVVPKRFRKDHNDNPFQGCDWTDGFFYTYPSENSKAIEEKGFTEQAIRIHQPVGNQIGILDPLDGKIREFPSPELKNMPLHQQIELTKSREFMGFAVEHSNVYKNIFGLDVCSWLNDNKIQLLEKKERYTNAFNELINYQLALECKVSENKDFVEYIWDGRGTGNIETGYFSPAKIAHWIAGYKESKDFIQGLLQHFESELSDKEKSSPLYKEGKKVLEEARALLNDKKPLSQSDKQLLAQSLVHAIQVIQTPSNPSFVKALAQDAKQTIGKESRLKKFLGALGVFAGAAIIALSIAGIPFTFGTSALIGVAAGGGLLSTLGGTLFAHGRQKSLSKALSRLSEVAANEPTYPEKKRLKR